MMLGLDGLAYFYIRSPEMPGSWPRASGPSTVPAQQVVLRRALRLHLRPPGQVARPLLWKKGDGWSSTASAPTASLRACRTSPAGSSEAADRLRLSLRLCDADRALRLLITWYMFSGGHSH
jgi:hypothetical protein